MITISPSLLSCDFLNIESELARFDGISNLWFHLDIMDGHFVPNLTLGHPIVKQIASVATHPLDAHFMVSNPEFYIDTFATYNIYNFTFHLEAARGDLLRLIKKAKEKYPCVGISIKPGTSVSELDDVVLKNIDLLLMMSVEPGFGGQAFMEGTYDRLRELAQRQQALGTNIIVQVDGGVDATNSKQLVQCGVSNLVAGSYIFRAGVENYERQIESLR